MRALALVVMHLPTRGSHVDGAAGEHLPEPIAQPMATTIASAVTHLPALDGLRGLAVALVLAAHLPRLAGEVPRWLSSVCSIAGYLGVDIFFVLSGFLITRIL